MPDTFASEALTMANVRLDMSAIERLIEMLDRMADLHQLYLSRVGVKSGTDLRGLAWPVSKLKDLNVLAESGGDCDA